VPWTLMISLLRSIMIVKHTTVYGLIYKHVNHNIR
jgi:hypothetical protein